MGNKNKLNSCEEIIVRPLVRKDVDDLINVSFPFSKGALNPQVYHKILQEVRLLPKATRLVAYHLQEKHAIGFLSLAKHTPSLYSIQYVFTEPKFRMTGVATKLLNYALFLAREKGAKRCILDVVENNIPAVNLYTNYGFTILSRIIEGQGKLSKLSLKNRDRLTITQVTLKRNQKSVFNIYRRCMGHEWVNFFETSDETLDGGYRYHFRRFFFKSVFLNDLQDSFAIVFNRPFLGNVTVELYSISDATTRIIMLKDILKILHGKGIENITIMMFRVDDNETLHLFKELGLNAFPLLCMGKRI